MSIVENTQPNNSRSTLSTLVVMSCTLVSRLMGFVRNALIASLFGAGGLAGVVHLTFAIPNNLRRLMAEGALSSAFIPEISAALVAGDGGVRARRLTSLLVGFQLVVLLPLSVLAAVFAEPLIGKVLTEISDPELLSVAIRLFRAFIFYIVLISVNATMMAVLNSHSRFFIPAFTPVLFSAAVISSLILFYRSLGVYSMAVGVLVGGVAQVLFQLPGFLSLGYSLRPAFRFRSPGFLRIMHRWGPVVAGSSVFSLIQLVAIRFASGIEEQGVAGLQNAVLFWQLPMGIFSASVVTVLFPRMSRQSAAGDTSGLGDSIRLGVDLLLVLLLPSMLVLSFLGREIIAVAYQRNLFTAGDTLYTYTILKAYTLGLFSVGGFNFLQRYYYSADRYRLVTGTALVVAVIDIGLSLWWKETSLGVAGLAYANSAAFSLGFLMLYLVALAGFPRAVVKKNLHTLVKALISLIPGTLLLVLHRLYGGDWWRAGAAWGGLLRLSLLALGFTIVTLGMYRIIGIDALSVLLNRQRRSAP